MSLKRLGNRPPAGRYECCGGKLNALEELFFNISPNCWTNGGGGISDGVPQLPQIICKRFEFLCGPLKRI